MSKCLNCKKYEDCSTGSGLTWPCGSYAPKVISNADHIRSMTDDELKLLLCSMAGCSHCDFASAAGCMLEDWLKQPYKEDA